MISVIKQLQKLLAAPELRGLIAPLVELAALLADAAIAQGIGSHIIGVDCLHDIIDSLKQGIPGQPLRETDDFLQPIAAIFAMTH